MDRKVNVEKIKQGISEHIEFGLYEQAKKCKVSPDLLAKVRVGYVPKKWGTRNRIANGYGVTEDELFPLVSAGGKAS